ncbi:MAG: PBP1A family penicillin-binding protein [Rhodospirillales bacterium]|nr:PBP1A family penicillin-binding protein [Rhodospirillales bacterium]
MMKKKQNALWERIKGTLSRWLDKLKPSEDQSRLKLFFNWFIILTIWGIVIGGAILSYFAYGLPDIESATTSARKPHIQVLDARGRLIGDVGEIYGGAVNIKDIPKSLPQAIMATEDRRFYHHIGLDFIGLARAMWVNLKAGRIVQGGSTITQQVAKNLFLTPKRTFKRKIQEVMMALWLEQKFTKDQIFTLYLNRVYFGARTYGVEAAARRYFGVSARKLSIYQSALIAGLLKAPSRYNPQRNPERAHKRTAVVLNNLVVAGYLNKAQADKAKKQKTRILRATARPNIARYFIDWAMGQAQGYLGQIDLDITIKTTLNSRLQLSAEKKLEALLARHGKRYNASQGAILVLNDKGAVRAMVGGRNYAKSQFNRVTQALRQPGSAFKPFVYLAGLDIGLTPYSQVIDEPITVAGWSPKNYKGTFQGPMSLTRSLAESINTVAVKVAKDAGVSQVIQKARKLGITSTLPDDLTIALGAGEVNLMEITAAYGPFSNGGKGVWPYGVTEIKDSRGKILYRRMGGGPGQVISNRQVNQMNVMLKAVVQDGTGKSAHLDRPSAGKTGTSQDFRDAWFIGYTGEFIAGVWVGNDNGASMKKVTGGGLPARLWKDVMVAAHQGLPIRPIPSPQEPKKIQPQRIPNPIENLEIPKFIKDIFKIFSGN